MALKGLRKSNTAKFTVHVNGTQAYQAIYPSSATHFWRILLFCDVCDPKSLGPIKGEIFHLHTWTRTVKG